MVGSLHELGDSQIAQEHYERLEAQVAGFRSRLDKALERISGLDDPNRDSYKAAEAIYLRVVKAKYPAMSTDEARRVETSDLSLLETQIVALEEQQAKTQPQS